LLALAPRERWSRAIDWRRLRIDVREPLRAGRRASWRTFDWETGEGLSIDELTCDPVPVVVIDGAYSSRPELQDVIDVSVLVKLEDHTRRSRLVAREGQEYMAQWHSIWDAAEDYYFSRIRPEESFNLILNTVLVVR
jgi:uridine kinase